MGYPTSDVLWVTRFNGRDRPRRMAGTDLDQICPSRALQSRAWREHRYGVYLVSARHLKLNGWQFLLHLQLCTTVSADVGQYCKY